MKKLLTLGLMSLAFISCTKKTECTTQDKSNWQDQETFKSKLVCPAMAANSCISSSVWWSMQQNNELFWLSDPAEHIDFKSAFWRVERQTLFRLPNTGTIVFGIRVFLHPLPDMMRLPNFQIWLASLMKHIESSQNDRGLWRYKNLLELVTQSQFEI